MDDRDRPGAPVERRDGWLSDDELLLHIGLPKTGTTALQTCLDATRSDLIRHGVLYPNTVSRRLRSVPNHVPAANAPLGWPQSPEASRVATEMWATMLEEIRAHQGRVVVSAENIAVASDAIATAMIEQLGGGRVRVMITVRPLHDLLPSFWQNEVRAGLRTPFEEWSRLMAAGPQVNGTAPFWVLYDLATLVERWAGIVGSDRLAVVVVDPSRPTGVYSDAEQLIGLPFGMLDPARSRRTNRSLSRPEAELVRALNTAVDGRVTSAGAGTYGPVSVGESAVWHLLRNREPGPHEPRLVLPDDIVEMFRPLSCEAVEHVRRSGVHVVGDLDQLTPPSRHRPHHRAGAAPVPEDAVPIDVVVLLVEHLMLHARQSASRPQNS